MDQPELSQDTQQPSIEDRLAGYLVDDGFTGDDGRPVEKPRDDRGRFARQEGDAQPEAEEQDAEHRADDDEPDEDVDEGEEASSDEGQEQPELYTVKVDGEEVQVTLDEALKGYMLNKDYTRKTQEIAEHRRQFQTQAQAFIEQQRQQYTQHLEGLQQAVLAAAAPELQGVNWTQLSHEDPATYVRLVNRANEVNSILERITQEQQAVANQREQEQRAQLEQLIRESNETLQRELPKWDREVLNDYMGFAMDTYNFRPDEIGQVVDWRMWKVLHDAIQWRRSQSKKPLVEKKVASAPKAARPGARQQGSRGDQRYEAVRARFKKSGKVDDLAEALFLREQNTRR